MVMKITIRGRISPKGGGDDAEHPSIIPMDSTPTHQAPRGPMTRARTRALETEVNSFLLSLHMDTNGTLLLPHQDTLCLIRYEEEHHQEAQEHPQGEEEPPQGHADQDGVQHQQNWKSQVTPCARAPETPCPRAIQEVGAGAPRAHGPVPCPRDPRAHGPNLPRAHGPPRMDG